MPDTRLILSRAFSYFLSDGSGGKPLRPVVTSQATTPDRNLCLPEAINELSDTHKQLLLGVIPISKPTFKAKKIVIYVCAAEPEGKSNTNVIFRTIRYTQSSFLSVLFNHFFQNVFLRKIYYIIRYIRNYGNRVVKKDMSYILLICTGKHYWRNDVTISFQNSVYSSWIVSFFHSNHDAILPDMNMRRVGEGGRGPKKDSKLKYTYVPYDMFFNNKMDFAY